MFSLPLLSLNLASFFWAFSESGFFGLHFTLVVSVKKNCIQNEVFAKVQPFVGSGPKDHH